eukprot:CAMPEP_0175155348 /NCGR_PEP_ID=MMETSP0087-20121206/20921_1 /TAXON_ID=136419 /ORGANISM="Unknown Unknown, Strain D1" /LENGTH=168 /DNA_ID=CAMNT_0016442485 /DNA_START=34 /DNA_END=540 /DNA_ORIENTATION=-
MAEAFEDGVNTGEATRHTTAAMFHVLFKAAAVLGYLFCSLFSDNFVLVFVFVVLMLAFDFWTTKNVSGRLLVGLRWWNEVKEDGTNVWIYESKPDNIKIHPQDSLIFWTALYICPLIWLVFAITSITRPSWLLVDAVALVLTSANVMGYWKCQKDAKNKLKMFLAQQL